jgi:multisubunit Na+/H+ antiporter MnhG subunit
MALVSLLNLTTVYRLLHTPIYLSTLGAQSLHSQVLLLLNSYRDDWSFSLIIFGIHLGLLGYLIYRSSYIPKIIGILLVIDGFFWVVNPLQPYLYPNASLGFLFPISFVELILPLWLVIRGWKIKEPNSSRA